MAVPYVFISYSRQDSEFVERLASGLREAGVETWIDRENISAGQNWQEQIEKGLVQAAVLIHVASRNSVKSNWMEHELTAFMNKHGRIIPVVIDDDGADLLPLPLRSIQWADFRGEFEPAFRSLLLGIGNLQGAAPISQPATKSKGYVFISYAEEDSEFVSELKVFLSKQGYAYWDFHESQRDYQSDYSVELEAVIKNAVGTLSVISPDWKRSRSAMQEFHFSREIETPVFLLKVQDPGPTLALAGLTHIDFTRKHQDGFVKLNGEMKRKGL